MELIIGIVCTILGVLIGVLNFGKNRDKDIKAEATRTAIIETKLDNISVGVTAIQVDFKTNDLKIDDVVGRMIKNEESTKSAHKRIDNIEKITVSK